MSIGIFVLLTVTGLFTGSFLNVCIDRLPRGQSIVNPPSHCGECKKRIPLYDLVPVFSYILLKGRCRFCGEKIPLKIPVIEAVTGVMFGLLYWKYGISLELLVYVFYGCLLLVVFEIDLENQLILDVIIFPAMAVALVVSFFLPDIRTFSIWWPGIGIESALVGGAAGLVAMSIPYLLYRKGMGMGDVKFGFLIGLMLGWPHIIVAILISWIGGGLIAALLLATKVKGLKDAIPSGTFMAVATMVALIWGSEIWQWYM